jgi:hypothetical protein
VLGDLNDEPTAATTQIPLGPPGSELGTAGFDRPYRGDGARLWNLAPLIPAERRFSRVFRGRGELIDHILVSHALVNRIDHVDTGTRPPSITEDPTALRDEQASDHAPIVARFHLDRRVHPTPPQGPAGRAVEKAAPVREARPGARAARRSGGRKEAHSFQLRDNVLGALPIMLGDGGVVGIRGRCRVLLRLLPHPSLMGHFSEPLD